MIAFGEIISKSFLMSLNIDRKITDEKYMKIPTAERKRLRFLAKLLGRKTETEIRRSAVENWQTIQRAWDPDASEK